MIPQPKKYSIDYQPGRTVEELEHQRFVESMKRTPEERFQILMKLIRISRKTRQATLKLNRR